jgi:hypothetical protein
MTDGQLIEALEKAALDHAKCDPLNDGIRAIHAAGWAAGRSQGFKDGFAEGRRTLSGARSILVPLLLVAGAAFGVWLFGITLTFAPMP